MRLCEYGSFCDAERVEESEKVRVGCNQSESNRTMRKLSVIGKEIRKLWVKPYFGAVPYIDALASSEIDSGMYYCDSAQDIVLRFLCNANTWRGDDARRIKAELKECLKG